MATPQSRPGYPRLPPDSVGRVIQLLTDVVSLQHADELAADQLRELRSCIDSQLAAAARLHQFPLSNDQEPIFLVRTDEGGIA
jgi:hypothetical protein